MVHKERMTWGQKEKYNTCGDGVMRCGMRQDETIIKHGMTTNHESMAMIRDEGDKRREQKTGRVGQAKRNRR